MIVSILKFQFNFDVDLNTLDNRNINYFKLDQKDYILFHLDENGFIINILNPM